MNQVRRPNFAAYYINLLIYIIILLYGCTKTPWDDPYPANDANKNIFYSNFSEQPKTLDPAQSYSSDEYVFVGNIYEPPLQYHYLKRPYTLVPLAATSVPQPQYYARNGKRLPDNAPESQIAYSVYTIHIKPGIYYQPHPAFAKNNQGENYYLHYDPNFLAKIHRFKDFPKVATRELTADDYVYQIKRLSAPAVQSPIFGLMSRYIVGFTDLRQQLQTFTSKHPQKFLDLRQFNFVGAKVIDRYTYQITLHGQYVPFVYWLTMPFFAPVPWEADYLYSLPGMAENDISLDWYPVGTGPYMLTENNPNRKMVLMRNPNFHGESFPVVGSADDIKKGYLRHAGEALPFVERAIFTLEKESIPMWDKFMQGYYDESGIGTDSFDKAVFINAQGEAGLTPELVQKKIRLHISVPPTIYYFGFNMLDNIVGGNSSRAQKLRQAISIAVNIEDYISIFLNGRGVAAQGPLPPGIFGYDDGQTGINPIVYDWVNGYAQRKSLREAQKLLAEAGYPGGRDPATGQQLILNYDATMTGPDEQTQLIWLRNQFAKLGIELNIRDTDYNRFQEKVRTGNAQIFLWGWHADYPDPENFLFLFYSPNGKALYGGENAVNYKNKEFDLLFEHMRNMQNGPERKAVIDQMIKILRNDSPWMFGFHVKSFALIHDWVAPTKPQEIANNSLKYISIDPVERMQARKLWNQTILWPLWILFGLLVLLLLPIMYGYWRKEHQIPKHPEAPK